MSGKGAWGSKLGDVLLPDAGDAPVPGGGASLGATPPGGGGIMPSPPPAMRKGKNGITQRVTAKGYSYLMLFSLQSSLAQEFCQDYVT